MPQLAIPGLVIQTPRYPDKNNKCKMFMENVLVSKAFPNWKYPADRIYLSKDLLITKTGGKYKIYAASYEAVRLKGAKALFVVSVASFCPGGNFLTTAGPIMFISPTRTVCVAIMLKRRSFLQNIRLTKNCF